jgi:hypothetical protein
MQHTLISVQELCGLLIGCALSGQNVCISAKDQQRLDSKQWLDQLLLLSLPDV